MNDYCSIYISIRILSFSSNIEAEYSFITSLLNDFLGALNLLFSIAFRVSSHYTVNHSLFQPLYYH